MRREVLVTGAAIAPPLMMVVSCIEPTPGQSTGKAQFGTKASISTLAGGTSTGPFRQPWGLALHPTNNRVYVADALSHSIKSVSTGGGAVATLAGSGTAGYLNGTGTGARFNYPRGIAFDGTGTYLYVVENYANCVRKILVSSGQVTHVAGSSTAGSADGGPPGTWTAAPAAGVAQFSSPWDIAWDSYRSTFVISDSATRTIRRMTTAGAVSTICTMTGVPRGLCTDTAGWIYVAVPNENRVYSIGPGGAPTVRANITDPWDVTVDVAGTMFIPSGGTHTMHWSGGSGLQVLTGTGVPGMGGGAPPAAQLNDPKAVVVGPGNMLYVAEYGNYAVRKIDNTGIVPAPTPTPPPPTPTPTP
ncbi:MAG: hypothetical protein H7338_20115, partial [Candidatus Sericytochromatia bacterium]|nr:hypothetical protein [Candidatus Sericytochromatia bacterium]